MAAWSIMLLLIMSTVSVVGAHERPDADGGRESPRQDETFDELEEDGDELDVLERPAAELVTLPGDCEAADDRRVRFAPARAFDCAVPLATGADPSEIWSAVVIDPFDEQPTSCEVLAQGREPVFSGQPILWCEDVGDLVFEEGSRSLLLQVNDQTVGPVATVVTAWSSRNAFVGSELEPVVFDGRPLRLSGFDDGPAETMHMVFTEHWTEREVNRQSIHELENTEERSGGFAVAVDLASGPDALAPGLYRMQTCTGEELASCVPQPDGTLFQVIDPTISELVPGHNRATAERINVLFVGSGIGEGDERFGPWPDQLDTLPEIARTMLGLDGPFAIEWETGELAPPGADDVYWEWGPFAVDPLASHVDRFNFWTLDASLRSETSLLRQAPGVGDTGFDLPNLQVTALYFDPDESASDARFTSFFDKAWVPLAGDLEFGDARVFVEPSDPLSSAGTLTHEWGHGLFGLRDEYYGFDGRTVLTARPNCAPDAETAEQWWGELVGAVDPAVAQVEQQLTDQGLDLDHFGSRLAELVRITPTLGGCYGNEGEATAFRPSEDSLMNSEIPVWGSVNRQQVEAVLSRFSGRGILEQLDSVEVTCLSREGLTTCNGVLPTSIDAPRTPLLAGDGRCWFGSDPDPVRFACLMDGERTGVDLTLLDQSRTVTVDAVLIPEPPAPEAGDGMGDEPGDEAVGEGQSEDADALATQPDPGGGPPTAATLSIAAAGLVATAVIGASVLARRRTRQ